MTEKVDANADMEAQTVSVAPRGEDLKSVPAEVSD